MTWAGLISVAALLATSTIGQAQTLVARGDYLVNGLLTCGNCHTPRGRVVCSICQGSLGNTRQYERDLAIVRQTAANQVCRASQFDEGWAIRPSICEQIPADFIGRTLSQDETADLLSTLTIGARYEALIDESEAVPA